MSRVVADPVLFTLVYDPTESYLRGANFFREAFEGTLHDGFWPTGSVWHVEVFRAPDYHIVVLGDMMEPQSVEPYTEPVSDFARPRGLWTQ